ncbi:MAG: MFS transporter [Lachnospiraceae bacterium]|nr:MFS transporter [Lachnospiraceae bacterium]
MSSEAKKIFTLAFFAISLAEVCVAVSLQMFESTFSLHIDSLHLPAFIAGSVIGAGAVSASVLRFFGGTLCEKAGRKRLLIAGVVIFASMLFFVGRTTSLFMMYLLTVIQMGGYSMASTAISVMIVDVVPRESLGKGMGYFGLASSLAGAIGPSLALIAFATKGAFRTVTAEAAAISALALFIAVFLIRYQEPGRGKGAGASGMQDPAGTDKTAAVPRAKGFWYYIERSALPASLINGMIVFVECLVTMFITLYAKRNGIENISLFFTISVIFIVISKIVSGRLADRYDALVVFIPGALSLALCFVLLILAPFAHMLVLIAAVFYGIGSGLTLPSLNAEAVRRAPVERASVASSTFFLPMDLAMIVGSTIWGGLIDLVDFKASYLVSICVIACSIVLSVLFLRKKD